MSDGVKPGPDTIFHNSGEGAGGLEDYLYPGLDPRQRPSGGLNPAFMGALLNRPKTKEHGVEGVVYTFLEAHFRINGRKVHPKTIPL